MSKTEFSVSVQAQSPACFVWLVAKDVRGRFSENGFLLTEPSKTVCTCVDIPRFISTKVKCRSTFTKMVPFWGLTTRIYVGHREYQ